MGATLTGKALEAPIAQPSRRSRWSLETIIQIYGSWTIAYWLAMAMGRGWLLAIPLFVIVLAALTVLVPPSASPASATADRSSLPAMLLILLIVLLWPVALEIGRAPLAILASSLLVARLGLLAGGRGRSPHALLGVTAGALAVIAAVAAATAWALLVVVVVLLGVSVVVWPSWPTSLVRRPVPGAATLEPLASRQPLSNPAEAALLLAFGILLCVWHVGTPFWNPDNTYYLNKAIHYGERSWSFPVQDLMYGVEGIQHVPYGNILSSYEPLMGVIATITTVSLPVVVFNVVAPGLLVLMPFAIRFAARGLSVPRSSLVGAFAVAAMLLMTRLDTGSLFAQLSLGKDLGRLFFIPILFGVTGRLVRAPGPETAVNATLVAICSLGMSPSLGIAALVVVFPFTAVAVVGRLWRQARLSSSTCWLLLPLTTLAMFIVFAAHFQSSSGQVREGFRTFESPGDAWSFLTQTPLAGVAFLSLLFTVGAVAVFPLVVETASLRRSAGLLLVVLFGGLFSPIAFDLVIGQLLDLNYFAWRILWALPLATLIGVVLANLDDDRVLGLLSVVALTIGLGLSGPTLGGFLQPGVLDVRSPPLRLPWEPGVPQALERSAKATVEAISPGSTFLAPARVEEVATGTQVSRFPTYARSQYIRTVEAASSTPASFAAAERRLLSQGINADGTSGDVTVQAWEDALAAVDVSAVCLPIGADAELRRAVEGLYQELEDVDRCTVWVRR